MDFVGLQVRTCEGDGQGFHNEVSPTILSFISAARVRVLPQSKFIRLVSGPRQEFWIARRNLFNVSQYTYAY
jgi:hypothetical protein